MPFFYRFFYFIKQSIKKFINFTKLILNVLIYFQMTVVYENCENYKIKVQFSLRFVIGRKNIREIRFPVGTGF